VSPALLATILGLIEQAITDAPEVANELRILLGNADPTPADWATLKENVLKKSYANYVPTSKLPPDTTN